MAAEEFKVILVGESGVGKTSFVVRFAESKFQNVYESTVGVDCKKVRIDVDGTPVDLHIWDTAGQERFKSIIHRFFRSSDGAIVMYDVTKKETFDEVPWWLKETREHLSGIPIFLVGNKNDAIQPEVLEELAQDLAEENRLYLHQTSAKDDVNVTHVFEQLAAMMLADRRKAAEEANKTDNLSERSIDSALDVRTLLLKPNAQPPKKGCCGYLSSADTKAHVV